MTRNGSRIGPGVGMWRLLLKPSLLIAGHSELPEEKRKLVSQFFNLLAHRKKDGSVSGGSFVSQQNSDSWRRSKPAREPSFSARARGRHEYLNRLKQEARQDI